MKTAMKRIIPMAVLGMLSLLLAACMSQPPAPPPPLISPESTQLMNDMRELKAQVESLKNSLRPPPPVLVPIDENHEVDRIIYTRESGKILVTIAPKNPAVAPISTANTPTQPPSR